jgi:hypothetical protein
MPGRWAVRWPASGGLQRLGDLGGNYAVARGMNDYPVVVGWGQTADGRTLPWSWNPSDGMTALPLAAPFTAGDAYAIDHGGSFVVGTQWYTDAQAGVQQRATVWQGNPVDLNTLVPPDPQRVLQVAVAINATGHILTRGTLAGQPRSFLLTPAEPMVALTVNQASFSPGQTLTATVTTQGAAGFDLYVGAIFPDGETLLLLTTLAPLNGQVVRLSVTNPAVFPKVTAGPQPIQRFAHPFTGLETPGTYHLVAALARPGAFNDGIIHGEDLVGFDWKAITVQVTPLHAKMLAIRDRHAGQ